MYRGGTVLSIFYELYSIVKRYRTNTIFRFFEKFIIFDRDIFLSPFFFFSRVSYADILKESHNVISSIVFLIWKNFMFLHVSSLQHK